MLPLSTNDIQLIKYHQLIKHLTTLLTKDINVKPSTRFAYNGHHIICCTATVMGFIKRSYTMIMVYGKGNTRFYRLEIAPSDCLGQKKKYKPKSELNVRGLHSNVQIRRAG